MLRCARARKHVRKAVAEEDIVAEHQARGPAGDEIGADREGLREALRLWLHRIGDAPCPTATRRRAAAGTAAESCGVVMIRTSRMPASISVVSG